VSDGDEGLNRSAVLIAVAGLVMLMRGTKKRE